MENLCIFYASKYHLSIVLLEYLRNKNIKKYALHTFLENEIEDEVNVLIKKYKFDNKYVNNVNFKKTTIISNEKFENKSDMIFIIEGSIKYMKEANEYVKKYILDNNIINVKIINCFDFDKQVNYASQILSKNQKILFTTGEKDLTNLS